MINYREPLHRRGLNARRVAKYSDYGPIEGYLGNGARYIYSRNYEVGSMGVGL